jgi:hypothetical protein
LFSISVRTKGLAAFAEFDATVAKHKAELGPEQLQQLFLQQFLFGQKH